MGKEFGEAKKGSRETNWTVSIDKGLKQGGAGECKGKEKAERFQRKNQRG